MQLHGVASDNETAARGAPGSAFRLQKTAWPLNLGRQAPYWQAGGPRSGRAPSHLSPWPYMTGCKGFIVGFPYGVASSLVANPGRAVNLGSAALAFLQIGTTKPQTGTIAYF